VSLPLAGHFAAAIRTCRGVAVGEDGVPNPTAQKIRVIREIRAKKGK